MNSKTRRKGAKDAKKTQTIKQSFAFFATLRQVLLR